MEISIRYFINYFICDCVITILCRGYWKCSFRNGEVSGSAGFIVAVMMLAGGIVSIATRKGSKGGNIAIIVLYGIASLTGFTLAGNYADLNIWAAWCLICTILAIISLVKGKKVE